MIGQAHLRTKIPVFGDRVQDRAVSFPLIVGNSSFSGEFPGNSPENLLGSMFVLRFSSKLAGKTIVARLKRDLLQENSPENCVRKLAGKKHVGKFTGKVCWKTHRKIWLENSPENFVGKLTGKLC